MKMNKILVVALIIVLVIVLAYAIFKSTKSNVNNIDIYENPIVSLVIIGDDYVRIRAGVYAYGDIVQDGIIDENDVKFMELLLNSKLSFSDSQKLLADLNRDGVVNNADLEKLKKLVDDNKELKYDIKTDSLEYGVSSTNDSTGCSWQSSNIINNITYGEYYAFARIKNTDKISLGYKFTYEENVEEEE